IEVHAEAPDVVRDSRLELGELRFPAESGTSVRDVVSAPDRELRQIAIRPRVANLDVRARDERAHDCADVRARTERPAGRRVEDSVGIFGTVENGEDECREI